MDNKRNRNKITIAGLAAAAALIAAVIFTNVNTGRAAMTVRSLQTVSDGAAQPVFDPDGIMHYCVYVETDHDTDCDGKRDLVKVLVSLPKEAVSENGATPAIFEARPYITGTVSDDGAEALSRKGDFKAADMYASPAPRKPDGTVSTAEMIKSSDPDDWNFYEDLHWYDYFLVRGFAVIECGGLGTKGSEGFEACGTDLETDAFKCVIEWLHGDRTAYASKDSAMAVHADWCSGRVGMTGRSYGGTIPFALACTGVKGLETIVPVAGIASWYDYYNSQGTKFSKDTLTELAAFCSGRYLDKADWSKISNKYGCYLYNMDLEERASNGDYTDFWKLRDYTAEAVDIKCPALIVQGLNDDNVRTKQFELMYRAYRKAGAECKVILHQGSHITPAFPEAGYEIDINGESYNELLNRWFTHFLCGAENDAEKMPGFTVQSNTDGSWECFDKWYDSRAAKRRFSDASDEGLTVCQGKAAVSDNTGQLILSPDEEDADSGVDYTFDVDKDTRPKGDTSVRLRLKAKVPEGADNVTVSVRLYDEADETFGAYTRSLGNEYVPTKPVGENDADPDGYDRVEFRQNNVTSKLMMHGETDLFNPSAGYDADTASKRTKIMPDTFYDYTIYMDPTVYTVKKGHRLRLNVRVLDANTRIEIEDRSSYISLPVK